MFDRQEADKASAILRSVLDETKGMDRRVFLRRLGEAAAGSVLLSAFSAMLGARPAQAAAAVTTMGWGGSNDETQTRTIYGPFAEKSGIPVNIIPYNISKVLAMHQANAMEVDFICGGGLDTLRLVKDGLAEKIDWTKVDKSALTPNQLAYGDYAIGSNTTSYMMVYNKEKWPGDDHPKSWRDFWDVEKFPGARAMGRYTAYPVLEYALMADGVPADPAKMYPLDVDRAFRSLDRIKPHITVWWESGAQQQQLIENKEVDLLDMWNGRATVSIRDNGASYEMVWNEAAYQGEVEGWLVLAGAPNPEGAMTIMDWLGRAEPQAAYARAMYYGPTNLKAFDLLDEEFSKLMPSYPANTAVQMKIDFNWWYDNFDAVQKRFESWLLG